MAGKNSGAGSKRSIDQVGHNPLRSSLEDLVARKRKDKNVPLTDIRDVLMDHVLGSVETDLKYTVIFACEEVPDLLLQDVISSEKENGSAVVAGINLLESLEGDYQFCSRFSDGDSIPRCDATLLNIPVSKRDIEKEKHETKKAIKKKIKKFKKRSGALTETDRPSAEFYILSPEELKLHLPSIPFEDAKAAAEFVSTKPLPRGTIQSPEKLLLALDCEMCRTTKGLELTRLTLIDANEKVLLDEYVRPTNPIVDYCTQYSGITRDIMEATTTRLADIQDKFLSLVSAEAILVGHSIENDLQALRVLHRRIIDTTCLYPHPKGPPFRSALRFLTAQFLCRAIQTGTDGHCSVEDAIATLQLAQLKIKHGPTFPSIEHEYKQKKVVNALAMAKKSVLIVDSQRSCRSLGGGVACVIPRESPGEVVQTVVHQLTTGFPPHLTWSRVRGLKRSEIVTCVEKIKGHMPEHSCLVILLSGETKELRALHERRTARIDPRSSLMWDKKQQKLLEKTAVAAQTGFVCIFVQ